MADRDVGLCALHTLLAAGLLTAPMAGHGATLNDGALNDSAIGAQELALGVPVAIDNAGATVQSGEVSPGRGSGLSCRAQDGWCSNASDPTNSLWYRFQASSETVAVFVDQAAGANLQLALWQAADPGNFASYLKLAANDDGNDSFAPGILPRAGLTAGADYLIQLSGQSGHAASTLKASSVERLSLAGGHLGAGAIGLFPFTLLGDVQGTDYFAIDTAGSSFDTEIGLYDSAGRLVASNNNVSPYTSASLLRFGFGGSDGSRLGAGNYTLVLGGFNTIFRDGDVDTAFPHQGDFQIDIQSTQRVVSPAPSFLARDGNYLPAGVQEVEVARGSLAAGEVRLFSIYFARDITGADWAAIHTTGSSIDTEIALFDANGHLVAENNNLATYESTSRLSFGFDGDDGATLPAGRYTVALGGFNTIFRDGLEVSSASSDPGDFALYLQTSVGLGSVRAIPEPAQFYLMALGLALVLARRRSR